MALEIFLSLFFVFMFGTAVGSFLNVVIYRYNTGRTLLDRSGCFSCGKTLSPLELVPLVSFFIQRGRCRSCGSGISFQYPLVEFLSGLVFLFVGREALSAGNASLIPLLFEGLLYLSAGVLLLLISAYDLKHKIVPDFFVYLFVGVGALEFVFRYIGTAPLLPAGNITWDALAGPLAALLFASFWYFSDGRLMGLGDAKLALGMGFFLGAEKMLSALLISFWAGGLVGIVLLFLRKKSFTMKSEIPFAPFLAAGTFLALLKDISIF